MTLSETVAVYKTCAAVYVSVGVVTAVLLGRAWVKVAFATPFLQELIGKNTHLRALLYAMIVSVSATLAAGWPTGLVAYLLLKALRGFLPSPGPGALSGVSLSDAQRNVLDPVGDKDDMAHAVVQIVNAVTRAYGPVQARRVFEGIIENWEAFVGAAPDDLGLATAVAVKKMDEDLEKAE
jgi:hypothetical protein